VKKAVVPSPKVKSLVIKGEKKTGSGRTNYWKRKDKPVPKKKDNRGRKLFEVIENQGDLEGILKQARRVLGSFTDEKFKDILRAQDLKARNFGNDVIESKEFFSDRFRKMTAFRSKKNPPGGIKPKVPDWVALCVFIKSSTEYHAVAMFDNPALAARLMGKGFCRQNIQAALTKKGNFSGTSGIINADDVCHWQYVKRQ